MEKEKKKIVNSDTVLFKRKKKLKKKLNQTKNIICAI